MAYFVPSYLQKRLLKYALSRLEILDTDALDLSSLDIAWGSRSTVELRDIGLRNQKLGPLLQLPPHVQVESTNVALVRLTVPADLYTSAIIIDIEQVTATAKAVSAQAPPPTKTSQRPTPTRHSATQAKESSELPNARDLAQSFLEQEPDGEREELQAFVAAQPQDLQQSILSDGTGDEEVNAGTGVGLSLPAFLAGFLKGISDRLQINIKDFSVTLLLEADDDGSASSTAISLKIDSIHVREALPAAQMQETLAPIDGRDPVIARAGRLIKLINARASVLTDKATYGSTSRASERSSSIKAPQSPTQTWSPSTTRSDTDSDKRNLASTSPTRSRLGQSSYAASSTRSFDSLGSRFADADDALSQPVFDGPSIHPVEYNAVSGSFASPMSSPLDSPETLSRHLHQSLETFRHERQPRRAVPSEDLYSTRSPSFSPYRSRTNSNRQETPTVGHQDESVFEDAEEAMTGPPTEAHASLTESRLFSHADAESIYLSVADTTAMQSKEEYPLPGGWGDASAYESPETDASHSSKHASRVPKGSTQEQSMATEDMNSSVKYPDAVRVNSDELESSQPQIANSNDSASPQVADVIEVMLFFLDELEVYIPDPQQQDPVGNPDAFTAHNSVMSDSTSTSVSMSTSSFHTVPGAFSSYADITSRKRGIHFTPRPSSQRPEIPLDTTEPSRVESTAPPVKVNLGNVRSRFETSAVPFLMRVYRKVQDILKPQDTAGETLHGIPEKKAETHSIVNVTLGIQSFNLDILDNDSAAPSPGSTMRSREGHGPAGNASQQVSVFGFKMDKLNLIWSGGAGSVNAKLTIDCITCDVAGKRLLSFNREATLGSSMRGTHAPVKDVTVTYSQGKGSPEVNITTLPVIFDLDFHRVDDTFSSFGGFSGLIELGNSIISDSDSTASPIPATERPRVVRFDSGVKAPRDEVQLDIPRINVRVNGGVVSLRGRESTIRYRSSALKLVVRESAVGIQIDEIILDAPYNEHHLPGLQLTLQSFGLKYLAHPEEHDLSRLISILTPSKDKFEEDDDFLLDTLVRQRKKGAAMRVNIANADLKCNNLAAIQKLQEFAVEMSKLAVARYLPEESRPGMLALGLVSKARLHIHGIPKIESLRADLHGIEFAHVGAPALVALGVQGLSLERGGKETLLKEVLRSSDPTQPPMIMARFIGDEMEPTVKIKLWNIVLEYTVPLAEMVLGLGNTDPNVNVAADLTASLANLTDRPQPMASSHPQTGASGSSASQSKPPRLDLSFRDCALALNPQDLPSRALFVLTQARLDCVLTSGDDLCAYLDVRKASILLIDDAQKLLDPDSMHQDASIERLILRDQLSDLGRQGYVSMCWISAATIKLQLTRSKGVEPDILDVDFGDELLVLESCADSTATLGDLFGALAPKLPPAKGERFRTEVASMQEMMASFSGDAFAVKPEDSRLSFEDAQDVADLVDDELSNDFDTYGQFPDLDDDDRSEAETNDNLYEYGFESDITAQPEQSLTSVVEGREVARSEVISGGVNLAKMAPQISPFAKKWDSTNNKYIHLSPSELAQSPIRVHARDVHIIWNLYDGYDWEKTRDVISKAVQEVQTKAEERRVNRRLSREAVEEEESVIGDFLFNSIYIGIPANHDPKELAQQINREMDDLMTETGSHTSTTATSKPTNPGHPLRPHGKKLRLQRSKRHKIAFELRGVSADYFVFPPNGETQSSLDIRVKDFEIYDHVPTSTWKKFLTYMHDAGPREDKKPMIHLELCDVRPIPELIASELVLRATVLPVRLHVDQDALEFMTRFFEFNDSDPSATNAPPNTAASAGQVYLQRVEVYPVPLKLDYKPKRVDYAGIRSGRTTEFKNFFSLDGADIVLKHAIIYGTSGFNKLHHSLEDVWTPDIMKNQLPSVLSGLSGVRTLVNVGAGMRDLVVVPVREYQKDGRIVRSISKGAMAFARSTGGEITRFGAKLAVGAQTALQGAEEFLSPSHPSSSSVERDWEDGDLNESEKRAISHYADQPAGFLQGLRGAARSLERDLLLTRDVIVAISGEIRESDTAEGAARVLVRHAPTLVLRPMIGASKAIGQTLMGANNSVDPANRRRAEDKYKRY